MRRAFIVRSGITSMLQLATPYANDEDIEGSLDLWVNRIKDIYPQGNVQWLAQSDVKKSKSKKKDKDGSRSGEPEPSKLPDLSKYKIPELKKKLVEAGLPKSIIELLSDSDIVENARGLGLLDKKK